MKKLFLLFALLPALCFAQTRPHWIDIKGKPLTSDSASTTYAIDGDGKTQPALRTVMFGNTHNHDGLLIGWPAAIATYSIVVP